MSDLSNEQVEHQRLIAALQERERQLAEAMRVGNIMPWEWDVAADWVTRALDTPATATVARTLETFLLHVHPDDRPLVHAALNATLEHDAPYAVTFRRVTGGVQRWFDARATLRRGADGTPQTLAGVVVEITALKQLEFRLAQSQKLEAIGLLAGGIAHDFNNVLTAIQCNAQLLLTGAEDVATLVSEILQASERAASLTQQLLAFSRRQFIKHSPVDLSKVVDEVLSLTRRTLGEDIDLQVERGAGDWWVKGDDGQLSQVLLNLVLNARDALPSGGKVRVCVSRAALQRVEAEALCLSAGDWVLLQVIDDGVGMDAPTRARIFEPFFTTKELGRGTGLGLSTVYGTVRQLGGTITVHSEPGQGTRFDVYLPLTARLEERPAQPPTRVATPATVLLAEDDRAIRELARNVLTRAGHRVTVAENGSAAVTAAHAMDGLDLLVTDVVMPGLGGMALAKRLRIERPGLKVLFISGYNDDAVFRSGVVESKTPLLRKPFSPQGLLDAVSEALLGAVISLD